MSNKVSERSLEIRRDKARNLRFKRAIVSVLNLEEIYDNLFQIQDACSDVQYWYAQDDSDTLLGELIGDEDEAYEFRIAFSALSNDCWQMNEDMHNEYIPDFFDLFFAGIGAGNDFGMLGFDSYEGDYFGLSDNYEIELSTRAAREKLRRHTKEEMIDAFGVCFKVALNYLSLKARFDNLKAALDVIRGENAGIIQSIKEIESLYEKIQSDGEFADWRELDRLSRDLPQETWIQ